MAAKLHLRYASMNAGKSTRLLQIAFNYGEMKKNVLLFTAHIDDRTAVGLISSRLGAQREALTFDRNTDFYDLISKQENIDCVLVDEGQFLSQDQVRQLHLVTSVCNIPVMCFALRTDFLGVPFEGSTYLLALAEDIQEIKAICKCGRKSTMNVRLDDQGNRVTQGSQVLIGGNIRYRQVCARCFYVDAG